MVASVNQRTRLSDVGTILMVLFVGLPLKVVTSLCDVKRPWQFKSILITGASSGIGAELARQDAGPHLEFTLDSVGTGSTRRRECGSS